MARIGVFLVTALVFFAALYVARTAIVVALVAAVVAGLTGLILWTMAKRALGRREHPAVGHGAQPGAPTIARSNEPARRR